MKNMTRLLALTMLALALLVPSAAAQGDGSTGDDLGAADIIQNDDVIVEGRICTSDQNACIDGEDFLNFGPSGFQLEAKLKDNAPALGFDSTTAADWVIGMNFDDILRFEWDDDTTSGATLFLETSNEVGINTLPSVPLHVEGNGSLAGTETVFRLDSVVPPQQIFRNTNTGTEWFFAMTADDQFKVSKNGTGVVEAKFFDNGNLQIAGTLIQSSDASAKTGFVPIDNAEILDAIAGLEITEWSYLDEDGVRHVGPTAQDFAAAFGLGDTDAGIAAIDADGVALAAIQALEAENGALQAQLDELVASSSGGPSPLAISGVVLAAAALLVAGRNGRNRSTAVAVA